LQEERIAAGLPIEATRTRDTMNVHGQTEPPGFTRDVKEEKVLERFVITCRRFAPSDKASISCARPGFVRVVEIKLTQVCRLVFDRHRTVSFLAFQRRSHHS